MATSVPNDQCPTIRCLKSAPIYPLLETLQSKLATNGHAKDGGSDCGCLSAKGLAGKGPSKYLLAFRSLEKVLENAATYRL